MDGSCLNVVYGLHLQQQNVHSVKWWGAGTDGENLQMKKISKLVNEQILLFIGSLITGNIQVLNDHSMAIPFSETHSSLHIHHLFAVQPLLYSCQQGK